MKPRITLVTLGVDDLERALAFYRDGLGLATPGIVGKEFEHGAVAFFDLQPGLKLSLWPRASLAHDTGLPVSQRGAPGFSLAHNVASRQEVDAVMARGRESRRRDHQAGRRDLLRRLCRLLSGSGRPPLGGGVESAV